MSNPYQPPAFDPKQFQDAPYGAYGTQPTVSGGFGWVSQVRIVAILNSVQGGLELVMGLGLVGVAIAVPYFIAAERAAGRGGGQPAEMEWILPLAYGGLGSVFLLAGIVRIYAGIQNFRYRGRILGIVSFCLGLVSMLGCYCAPTAIGVLIYGLIVYLNPAVTAAFEMGAQGMKGDAILASFAAPQPYQPPPSL